MTEGFKPVTYGCIVCGQKSTNLLSCDDPAHQEIAAGMMETNAGIPTMTRAEPPVDVEDMEIYPYLMGQPEIPANHLIESPLGMDIK